MSQYIKNLFLKTVVVLLLFCCSILQINLIAQSVTPYRLDWKIDAPLIGVGIGLNVYTKIKKQEFEVLKQEEIARLNIENINAFDRSSVNLFNNNAKFISDVVVYSSFGLPLTAITTPNARKDILPLSVMYAETFMLNYGLTNLAKIITKRPRPFVYNSSAPMSLKQKKDARFSFFSGHTSVSASNSMFAAEVYRHYYPNSDARIVYASANILPLAAAVTRILAGKHFITDVTVGYLAGVGIGLLVPRLHL